MFNIGQIDPKLLQALIQQEQGNTIGLPNMQAPVPDVFPAQRPTIQAPTPDVFPAQQPVAQSPLQQFAQPQQQPVNLQPADPTPRQNGGAMLGNELGNVVRQPVDLTPAGPTPKALTPYEQRITQLMEERGWDRAKAEANQAYAISRGHDLDGDGVVTDTEFGSGYTSTENPDVHSQYRNTGNGMGSIYVSGTGREDENGLSQQQRVELIKSANDELLTEGEEWGFADNTQGGPYGGPSLYESDEWINNIDYNAGKQGKTIGALTGQGNGSLSGRKGTGSMGDINPNTGQPIVWTEGEIAQGAKLGEIVDTPAGRYMVVNGANGQLALKGLKGAAHGGGNYFFNMVNKGHHVGINPRTGDVWYQGAPEVLAAAERASAADGDFWTAFQGGPDDDGVWDQERIDNFLSGGTSGGMLGTNGSQTTWQDLLNPNNTVLNGLFGGRG